MLRTHFSKVALLTTALVSLTPAFSQVPGDVVVTDPPAITQTVPANTGWTIMQGFWTGYACQTFGQMCSKSPSWQGNLSYNFGQYWGGDLSFGLWYAQGGPRLGNEKDPGFDYSRWFKLPVIDMLNVNLHAGYDFFNPDGKFGSTKNNMADIGTTVSTKSVHLGSVAGIQFDATPSVQWIWYIGGSGAAFADYGGFNPKLNITAHVTDKLSFSATPGKVYVYQGPYKGPWQLTLSTDYVFSPTWSVGLAAKYAHAGKGGEWVEAYGVYFTYHPSTN